MLMPGTKKTHRSYVWAYATSQFSDVAAVVYDFSSSRAGEHARNFLQDWKGKLVCDDFGGYKASFELGVTEIGCMAHTRRKFFELHATNKSTLAEQALRYIQLLYEIEREVRDLEPDLRRRIRQECPKVRPSAEHSITALNAGQRCRATSMTGRFPLIIIGRRTRSGHGLLGARTGSSPGRYAAENGLRRS